MTVFAVLFTLLLAATSYATEPVLQVNDLPPGVEPSPFMAPVAQIDPIEKVSPGVYRLGGITIDKVTGSVAFPVQINMDKGLLEYLLVRNGGKTHESLLRTAIEPYYLNIALLLIGLEGTDQPLPFQGAPAQPKGTAVEITLTVVAAADGMRTRIDPASYVVKIVDNVPQPVDKIGWVFTGSVIMDGRFLAQSEGSMIALYHDPIAMIDNTSPEGKSDEVWFVREGVVLPIGTPLIVTIKAMQ